MKLVAFDLDGTLVNGRSILFLAEELGFHSEAEHLLTASLPGRERARRLASYLKGVPLSEFMRVVGSLPLMPGALETVGALRKAGHRTAIITDSYDLVAEPLRRRLGMDRAVGLRLKVENERLTGEVEVLGGCPSDELCRSPSICKWRVLESMAGEMGLSLSDTVAVGDNLIDLCMIKAAGLGIAFEPKAKEVEEAADAVVRGSDLRGVLKHISGDIRVI